MTPVLALRIQRHTMQISWTDTLMNSSTSTGFIVMLVRRFLTSRSTHLRYYQFPVQFDLLPVLSTSGSIWYTSGFINCRFNSTFFQFYQLPVQFNLLPLSSTTDSNRPASGFTNFQFNAHFRYHSDFIYQRIYKITVTLLNTTTNRFALTFTEAIEITTKLFLRMFVQR